MAEAIQLPPKDFRKLQMLQLDCLIELDRVCRKHNIPYVMYGGTMLGAIRHKGFIPWDDDIDVAMLREDYERFRTVAEEMDPKICFLQDHRLDPNYLWGHSKLRRTGTKYIRAGQEHMKYRTEVSIDVFPMDDQPDSSILNKIKRFHCFCLRKILWSQVASFDKSKNLFWRIWWNCLSKIDVEWVWNQFYDYASTSRNGSKNRVGFFTDYSDCSWPGMPKSWFLDRAEYDFEGYKFFGPKDYKSAMIDKFGENYMTPPPENDRAQHTPTSYYDFNVQPLTSRPPS